MKHLNSLLAGLAVVALASCTNDEPANNGNLTGEARYMAVTISTSQATSPMFAPSRAEGDYEHGEAFESAVSTLDFYFFDAAGNAASVKSDGTNHLNVTPKPTNTPENENITNAIEAVLVISTPDDGIPEQIVAVINKETGAAYAGLSIEELQKEVTEGRNGNSFVMTNSAYVSGNVQQIGAHIAGHLCTSEKDALANPVTIYVERTLAKVRLTSNVTEVTLNNGTIAYDPQDEKGYDVVVDGEETKTENKKIYVQFLGWNTTVTSTNNRVIKKIDENWNPKWTWNTADYHRSFWAINAEGNGYDYFKFETAEGESAAAVKPAKGYTKFDGTEYTYIKENASSATNPSSNPELENRSKVIIAAQLVDIDGNPVEFAEWAFQRMTKEDLKKAFADAATLYYKEEILSDDNTTTVKFNKIDPSEIELKTAAAVAGAEDIEALKDVDRRYLVYGALTKDASEKTWYRESRLDATALSKDEINEIFLGLGGAKVYTEGRSYYYFDIRHLAHGMANAEFGQYGVVRNHVYDAVVGSIKGLGTPVYDPQEVIIPEKPSDDNTFIAAEIKVLSWRLVNFNVGLDWTPVEKN